MTKKFWWKVFSWLQQNQYYTFVMRWKFSSKRYKYVDQVRELVKDEDAEVIVLSVGAEADITELESYEERQVFLEDRLTEPGASVLIIRANYWSNKLILPPVSKRLELINVGSTAPQAAGVIHTDFEKDSSVPKLLRTRISFSTVLKPNARKPENSK
jgi:ribosome-binding ATPase YchF (GTP1/OBG family)